MHSTPARISVEDMGFTRSHHVAVTCHPYDAYVRHRVRIE